MKSTDAQPTTEYMTITYLRKHWHSVIRGIEGKLNHYIIITRYGKPVTVLMSIEEHESIEAGLQLLKWATENPNKFKRMIKAHKDFQQGKRDGLIDLDDID